MSWLAWDFVVRKVCVRVLGVKEGGCLDVESGILALAVFEVVLCQVCSEFGITNVKAFIYLLLFFIDRINSPPPS